MHLWLYSSGHRYLRWSAPVIPTWNFVLPTCQWHPPQHRHPEKYTATCQDTSRSTLWLSIKQSKANQNMAQVQCLDAHQTSCARSDAICPRPLQVNNIFTFIRQVAPVSACWLFKTSATNWPLTFWPLKWCPSHVRRGLPLCQF